jgi:5-methylcytosine-specific restriction protein A
MYSINTESIGTLWASTLRLMMLLLETSIAVLDTYNNTGRSPSMPLKHPPKATDPRDAVPVKNYTDPLDLVDDERGVLSRSTAYGQTRWKAISAIQLSKHPLCQRCSVYDTTTIAHHSDHVLPHRGDMELFWKGRLQSLCVSCHSYKTVQEGKGVFLDYTSGKEVRILDEG